MFGNAGESRVAPLAIIVMGVSGSGKSTLGALLAQRLDCAFLEGDAFHSAHNVEKMRNAIPLTDADRWPWLDRLGDAVQGAVGAQGLAVAACSALRRSYRERLAMAAHKPMAFILLNAPAPELARRLDNRPGHYMSPHLLDSQLATLELPGTDEQALILDASAPPEALCDDAISWLGRHSGMG